MTSNIHLNCNNTTWPVWLLKHFLFFLSFSGVQKPITLDPRDCTSSDVTTLGNACFVLSSFFSFLVVKTQLHQCGMFLLSGPWNQHPIISKDSSAETVHWQALRHGAGMVSSGGRSSFDQSGPWNEHPIITKIIALFYWPESEED
jgi:hypothetical protein